MKVLIVTNMYPTEEDPAFGTFVEAQVESIRKTGIEVDVLFVNGRKSILNYVKGILQLWKKVRSRDYDLVHGHHIFAAIIGRMQWKCPVIATLHGSEIGVTFWVSVIVRLTCRSFDCVIVVSERMKALLKGGNIRVIPCGVDLGRMKLMPALEARVRLDLPGDGKLVLWAGDYRKPEKRFYLVRESVELLKKRVPSAELVVLSGQPCQVVPAYMNACDVLVLASSSEGSPMVIKEAMACNLPIVSTDVGDVKSVIGGVEGCYLVRPEERDIADKLEKALAGGRRTAGRERIAHLDEKIIAQKIAAVYRGMLAVRRLPSC